MYSMYSMCYFNSTCNATVSLICEHRQFLTLPTFQNFITFFDYVSVKMPTLQLRCANGKKIPWTHFKDGREDCPNGEDEMDLTNFPCTTMTVSIRRLTAVLGLFLAGAVAERLGSRTILIAGSVLQVAPTLHYSAVMEQRRPPADPGRLLHPLLLLLPRPDGDGGHVQLDLPGGDGAQLLPPLRDLPHQIQATQ